MRKSKRVTAGLIATLAMTMWVPATSANAGCYSPNLTERSFAHKMNLARQSRGKSGMRLDPQLSKVAKVHTREMVRAWSLHHTPSTTLRRRVTNWRILGENVGVGGTVTSLHSAFMNSPAHRDNILYTSYRHVGVGTMTKNGRLWVTVIFEASSDPGSPLC